MRKLGRRGCLQGRKIMSKISDFSNFAFSLALMITQMKTFLPIFEYAQIISMRICQSKFN